MLHSFVELFAQATNAIPATSGAAPAGPDNTTFDSGAGWRMFLMYGVIIAAFYFVLIRPQVQAKKKQEDTIKSAKTGDKVVTSSGIHGYITNVKDTTVIVKVADNTKLEIEKSHIDKITRPDSSDSDKAVATKA